MAYRSPPPLTTETTITVDVDGAETEIEVTCEFDYTAAERGSRERGTGLQMEPDYPAEATLLSAKDEDGKDWYDQLSKPEIERLEIDAVEDAETPDDDGPDYDPDDDFDPDYIGPD